MCARPPRPAVPRGVLPLGHVVATPAALELLAATRTDGAALVDRHARADWGDVSPADCTANDAALVRGERVLSAYAVAPGARLLILTAADRGVTVLLTPADY